MVEKATMPKKSGDSTDGPRALLTAREREIVSGEADDVSDSYRYQTVSRVRRRIEEQLEADMRALDAHQSLGEEVRSVVCEDPEARGPSERWVRVGIGDPEEGA